MRTVPVFIAVILIIWVASFFEANEELDEAAQSHGL
jgi:hypothetical protein